MSSAAYIFSYFDVKKKGRVKLEEFAKVLKSNDGMAKVMKADDVTEMLENVAKNGYVDLDGWIMFTFEFQGPYEVYDARNGTVVEKRNDSRKGEARP